MPRRTTILTMRADPARIFALAREFDVDIDMHLDSGNSPDEMDIHLVCELTEKYKLGGRVAVGHGCKYSTLPPADWRLSRGALLMPAWR